MPTVTLQTKLPPLRAKQLMSCTTQCLGNCKYHGFNLICALKRTKDNYVFH